MGKQGFLCGQGFSCDFCIFSRSGWFAHFSKLYCKALSLDQPTPQQPTASRCCLLLLTMLENEPPGAWQGSHFKPGREKRRSGIRVLPTSSILLIQHRLPPGKRRAASVPFAPRTPDVGCRAAKGRNCKAKSRGEPGSAVRGVTPRQPEFKIQRGQVLNELSEL